MASSETVVALYMAVAEKEPVEEAANLAELSRRIPFPQKESSNEARNSSSSVEVTGLCADTGTVPDG